MRPILTIVCVIVLIAYASSAGSQDTDPYNLKVAVDEVELTLHAADTHGLPVNDLRVDELRLLDNGRSPHRIVAFQALRDLPIRAGILIDTSSSMEETRPADQAIATAYAQRISHDTSGNFILLFSDGEDDASYLPLQSAVDMCQQTNTSIYVFRSDAHSGSFSTGLGILSKLAALTGGRVFRDSASPFEIEEDLRIIQANLRNQYRLIYNPAELRHDASFHRIIILPSDRIATISTRSGYYAPAR